MCAFFDETPLREAIIIMITITVAPLIAICLASRGDWANVPIIALSGSPCFFGEIFGGKFWGTSFGVNAIMLNPNISIFQV